MLIFIDESGQPRHNDPSPFSVLSAIALKAEHSRDFSREIFKIKKNFREMDDAYAWEIKGRMLLGSKYISPRRREFTEEIFALCREYEVKTFASIMERPKNPLLDLELNPHIHELSKYLMRRVNRYVLECYQDRRAIFLYDAQDDKSNERLARRFTDFLFKTKKGWEYLNILDTPFFVNSKMTPGIQVADLFAYIINKRFQRKGIDPIEKFYKEIKDLQFEWENEEEGYGLRGIKFIQKEAIGKDQTVFEEEISEIEEE